MTRLFLFLSLLLGLSAACDKPPKSLRLLIVHDLHATTEPCGCTSSPKGGFVALEREIASQADKKETILIFSGRVLSSWDDLSSSQQRAQAQATAQFIRQLNPQAVLTDESEFPLARHFGLPIRQSQTLFLGQIPLDLSLDHAGHLRIRSSGKMGLDNEELLVSSSERPGLYRLSSQGFSGQVEVLNRGQNLVVIDFIPGDFPLRIFDGGISDQQRLRQRIERRRQTLAQITDPNRRQLRAQGLVELERSLERLLTQPPAPPSTAYIHPQIVNVLTGTDKGRPANGNSEYGPDIPGLSTLLSPGARVVSQYNRSLCDLNKKSTADKKCQSGVEYIGTARCATCHPAATKVWQSTAHARAWVTLERRGKVCDLSCVGCHSVGFDQPGGYCQIDQAPKWGNVGCEACHGPGGEHIKAPFDSTRWSDHFSRRVPEQTCRGCHNAEHSDLFDNAKYRPKILGEGHMNQR